MTKIPGFWFSGPFPRWNPGSSNFITAIRRTASGNFWRLSPAGRFQRRCGCQLWNCRFQWQQHPKRGASGSEPNPPGGTRPENLRQRRKSLWALPEICFSGNRKANRKTSLHKSCQCSLADGSPERGLERDLTVKFKNGNLQLKSEYWKVSVSAGDFYFAEKWIKIQKSESKSKNEINCEWKGMDRFW